MPRLLALTAISLLVGVAAPAAAADPPARPNEAQEAHRAEAKAIANRGDAEFYAGRCDKAIALWQEAEAAYHAPTILVRIARCQALLGRVVEASATLAAVIAEPLREGSPPAFYIAQEQAKREIVAVRARIATLRVVASTGRDRAPIVVEIDGVARREGDTSFSVDPGEHTVRVRGASSIWQTTVKLRDGEQLTCDVALWAELEPKRPRIQRSLGVAALTAGGAAIAVGVGFSVAALAASRHADALCGAGHAHCPPSARGDLDRARDFTKVADGTIGGGVALVIAGAVALATVPRAPSDTWRVHINASPTAVGLRLDF